MHSPLLPRVLTRCLVGVAFAGAAVALSAPQSTDEPPVPQIQLHVTPDHPDWLYEVGQPAIFRVAVTADGRPLEGVTVSYTLGADLQPGTTRTALVPATGLEIAAGTLAEPGFLRCKVTAEIAGHRHQAAATAGFSPTTIVPYQTEPADFDAFWDAGRAELAAIPMDAQLTLLPTRSTAQINVYHVSFRTIGPNWTTAPSRIFGILCEPVAPGRYPAILRTPGAGIRPYTGDRGTAERGAITLEIGVHGIPVDQPAALYDALLAGALQGYWFFNLDDRSTFYFRRILLGCLRANDFLASRPHWDGRRLMVLGASQGGQLAIATAALDPRVTGLGSTHPAFCDLAAPLHGRAGGWPHPFQPGTDGTPSIHATPAKIETARYYDTVNFARRVRVPGFYTWGFNDEVCPPTSTYAAYNVVTAPKTLFLTPAIGHDYPPNNGPPSTLGSGAPSKPPNSARPPQPAPSYPPHLRATLQSSLSGS